MCRRCCACCVLAGAFEEANARVGPAGYRRDLLKCHSCEVAPQEPDRRLEGSRKSRPPNRSEIPAPIAMCPWMPQKLATRWSRTPAPAAPTSALSAVRSMLRALGRLRGVHEVAGRQARHEAVPRHRQGRGDGPGPMAGVDRGPVGARRALIGAPRHLGSRVRPSLCAGMMAHACARRVGKDRNAKVLAEVSAQDMFQAPRACRASSYSGFPLHPHVRTAARARIVVVSIVLRAVCRVELLMLRS